MLQDAVNRFFSHVRQTEGCWEWSGGKARFGYGAYWGHAAHRVLWEHVNGPIPAGLFCLHSCDNPSCVRPDHLRLGTQTDNMREKVRKGRGNCRGVRGAANTFARHDEDTVRKIRAEYPESGLSMRAYARAIGIPYPTVQSILAGKIWNHLD